jgi:hypothetical protein
LDRAQLCDPGSKGAIEQDRRSRHLRRNLFEQLKVFCALTKLVRGKTGNSAPRPRQARDETLAHRIGSVREHDGHRTRRLSQCAHFRTAVGNEDVWGKREQFCRVFANALGIACTPACVDPQVCTDGPPQLLQALCERHEAGLSFLIVCGEGQEHADATHPIRLLCTRHNRPRRRPAQQRDELDHDGNLSTDQLLRQRWQLIELPVGPPECDVHVMAFDIAGFFQTLAECRLN